MPTHEEVIEAFVSLGGEVNQPMAVRLVLEQSGFASVDAVTAINDALSAGLLLRTTSGGIRLPLES
jgi:hypothetical protein